MAFIKDTCSCQLEVISMVKYLTKSFLRSLAGQHLLSMMMNQVMEIAIMVLIR